MCVYKVYIHTYMKFTMKRITIYVNRGIIILCLSHFLSAFSLTPNLIHCLVYLGLRNNLYMIYVDKQGCVIRIMSQLSMTGKVPSHAFLRNCHHKMYYEQSFHFILLYMSPLKLINHFSPLFPHYMVFSLINEVVTQLKHT